MEMWDLLDYCDDELYLILKNQESFAMFGYPWTEPIQIQAVDDADHKAQSINIATDRLFTELKLRARFYAFLQLVRLSRSSLNGGIPTSLEQMHRESLKFALRRYEKKLITSQAFLGMLRSAALIESIPDSFWTRMRSLISASHVEKLKQSMVALTVFHSPSYEDWLEDIQPYMSRVLWFANEFDAIKTVAKQLAILYPEHRDSFNDLGDKAASMILRAEIEAEQASKKPWQRSAGPSLKRSVKTVPSARSSKKSVEEGGGENI